MGTGTRVAAQEAKDAKPGTGASRRNSPEGSRTAISSPSAIQAGSTLLPRHPEQSKPPQEGHGPGPTMVTSHQQTPTALPELHRSSHPCICVPSGQMLDVGARQRHALGKPHLTTVFRLLGAGFCSGRAAPILLPSSVCSAAFLWAIFKAKPGLFGGLALPLSPGTWRIPKGRSGKLWGPDFLPIPCSHLSQRGDICSSLPAPKSRMEAATQPCTSPLSPQTRVRICYQKEINPHPNDLVTQEP